MMRRTMPSGIILPAMRSFASRGGGGACSTAPLLLSSSSKQQWTTSSSVAPMTTMSAQQELAQKRHFSTSMMRLARGSGHSPRTTRDGGGGVASSIQQQFNIFKSQASGQQSSGSTADSLTPNVRQHLVRVYNLLGVGVATCACGSAVMMLTPLGRAVPYWAPMVGGFVPLLWLMFAPPKNPALKVGLFLTFTALEGMTLAPIVYASAAKGVLGSALVMTAAVFGGFSAAAYLSPRASLLAFQGPLIGLLMGMVAISLLNMIYPTAFAHSIVLYGGLALFSALVAVDTQAMIERARCGVGDHVQDALQMFLNVVNIFVRISAILRGMGE